VSLRSHKKKDTSRHAFLTWQPNHMVTLFNSLCGVVAELGDDGGCPFSVVCGQL